MIFAKIDYINLLPFYVFIKKYIQSSQIKSIINYKKSYPSYINKLYKKRKIDAAFISSIVSKNRKCSNIGIIAQNEVFSVLAIKGESQDDIESASSNVLAKILKIKGKVIIGDKALEYYYKNKSNNCIDLAKEWKNKYNLPFVFARFCFQKHNRYFTKLISKFEKEEIKIPQYILNKYAKRSGLSKKQILDYLDKINYKIGYKEEKAIKLFLKLSKKF
ncbi:Menaquinone via 6-amino-6-deoxyfutalosine step 1 [hydrothermal vent metagenome]|uniref:Menaquinone via 6-amino-6-deoxyfutalosine step 1 n=1 Tax=hydrothermal vent metagenome TaxID=652676 RepID=A0A3B1E538_9ZZZZ